mmetsp:Transcript_45186/g.72189  ORF Transcript_45186/g.72189 Transcript_45186/m.72189 type:complete len:441 (+) Transcript_45186:60-1382(+)|eukprot:CAMPEP_0197025482 /NCGR_PEP_ID=MMETSP1384-20130603/5803_1 /TAXON_ID=29189 /ORGANISM="Ammonia sp." /LENGTH=440 /DNA_ID=CAMNT_0042454015 /DNA_START=50 /DNA_END=1372 /DNA_ORIENTATION=+
MADDGSNGIVINLGGSDAPHNADTDDNKQEAHKKKMSKKEFSVVRVIGKGGYGEVRVVRNKNDNRVYAMKTLLKKKMIEKKQQKHVRTERDLMVNVDHWLLVRLYWSFQDDTYLYLVMEYCPGGDLMKILIKEDILSEPVTRFYMAECAAAIACLHDMDYVHRDLKPDNMLISKDGHLKLSDFGLAKHYDTDVHSMTTDVITKYQNTAVDSNASGANDDDLDAESSKKLTLFKKNKKNRKNRALLFSAVGTPNYIAPEVFTKKGYGEECDWWSLGVILFECVVGYPPFYADTPMNTVKRIVNYQKTLRIPKEANLSKSCKDVIFRLICAPKKRLTFHQLKRHGWFKRVPWHNLQAMKPPWIPRIDRDDDTRYFEEVKNADDALQKSKEHDHGKEDEANSHVAKMASLGVEAQGTHFQGFTFERPKKTKTNVNDLFGGGGD